MMTSWPSSCYHQGSLGMQTYGVMENIITPSSTSVVSAIPERETHSSALLYNLSTIRDKVQQVQSLLDVVVFPDQGQETSVAIAGMGTVIQEIITTASSMMYTCQKMALDAMVHSDGGELHHRASNAPNDGSLQPRIEEINPTIFQIGESPKGFFSSVIAVGYHNTRTYQGNNDGDDAGTDELQDGVTNFSSANHDIIELDAANLLTKFTHYCHVCGKGFKRDANLKMHMRAHGEQYKSKAALSNPMKNSSSISMGCEDYSSYSRRKYSCPQEGCRWNKKHAKFQPLKSMICVKNHYKRSHCPKMYVCNRCNQKQFSLLSDLRTHEKHCGNLKWQCSCGTTFSRKDKLMGHLALFVGHAPAIDYTMEPAKLVANGTKSTGVTHQL
ncbi:hypothetical protein AAC387_Pa10g1370 [Persea americana]